MVSNSEARKRKEENAEISHRHKWRISVSQLGPDLVFCDECLVKFNAPNQQMPYYGVVPEKFQ